MKLLKQLYTIHAPSGEEKNIRTFIVTYIKTNIPNTQYRIDKMGNLYITKGIAETYPCIVAHLDQVQDIHSKDFQVVETDDIIFGYSPSKRQMEGLGADDKNGIWIALQCLAKYDAIKVAFFVQEEIGCKGSYAADISFFINCRFVIEPDRRGYHDIITNISGSSMCSLEFITDVQSELFGYEPQYGFMTDIEALRNNGLNLSCINVSCGYYKAHTDNEYTVKKDLLNCLDLIQHIIENCTKVYPHNTVFDQNNYGFRDNSTLSDLYEEYTSMMIDIIWSGYVYTVEDAWDVYGVNFPDFSY